MDWKRLAYVPRGYRGDARGQVEYFAPCLQDPTDHSNIQRQAGCTGCCNIQEADGAAAAKRQQRVLANPSLPSLKSTIGQGRFQPIVSNERE